MPSLDANAQRHDQSSHVAQAFMAHALAGAAAGMAETAVMYPLDTIKTRLQVKYIDICQQNPWCLPGCVMHVVHVAQKFEVPLLCLGMHVTPWNTCTPNLLHCAAGSNRTGTCWKYCADDQAAHQHAGYRKLVQRPDACCPGSRPRARSVLCGL